jgi:hypothetical protein
MLAASTSMNAPEDLDKLAAALGGPVRGAVRAGSSLMIWLEAMADRHASDLLLLAGIPDRRTHHPQ